MTVSNANAAHITQAFHVQASHVRVIPCGVDTDMFRPGVGRVEPPLIACVARLVPVKNHALLLEACASLAAQGTPFTCVLAGDGKDRDAVAALRARLALDTAVEMVGALEQTDVRRLWQRASVGVLASTSEGMPVSLMEAAACGVPVVATAVGGVPELVVDGETGILVPSGDVNKMTAALEWLLTDRELAARMGRAARRRAEERFSVTRQVDRLLELWRAILRPGVAACAP